MLISLTLPWHESNGAVAGDSCPGRVSEINKICIVVPHTAVVKLLQHSGLGSNTGMGFLRTNDLSEIKTGELNLDFGV